MFPASRNVQRLKLIHTLPTGQQPVLGVTVLGDEVFIVRRRANELEVYNWTTWKLKNIMDVKELASPWDLTSCTRFHCIYVADRADRHSPLGESFIYRVALSEEVIKWPIGFQPGGLSVTPEPLNNVLVTCDVAGKIKEFSTDGELIREIRLSDDVINPFHAILSNDDRLIVSHGASTDPLCRIFVCDSGGRVTQSYGGKPGSAVGHLRSPQRLAVDGDGNVIVADAANARVLRLSADLTDVRELVSTRQANRFHPMRLCVAGDLIYLTCFDNRNVSVFKMQDVK